ncbi:helix-turn-helix domain-containing protein [Microbacterium sp. PAMC21962]|uniref:helix-turn-helix domain-containing protein n=1 Tax=Microbacterium sp. PAMC21962 TaxID=2861280 RepID=UPI001C630380|nr:helix-turn-helix domain-containing protein [Microbacterium sp. PAMC21962]QYF98941.1 helix-turn-helix domain-containing protein [Microbacterium sp. PAMC21962]
MSNVTPLNAASAPEPEYLEVPGFEDLPVIMSPRALAEILDISTKSLERYRADGTGPRWIKLPGSSLIRYTRRDVAAWLEQCSAGGAK